MQNEVQESPEAWLTEAMLALTESDTVDNSGQIHVQILRL